MHVAERVRAAITQEFAGYPVALTASCGVACTLQTGDEETLRIINRTNLRVERYSGNTGR